MIQPSERNLIAHFSGAEAANPGQGVKLEVPDAGSEAKYAFYYTRRTDLPAGAPAVPSAVTAGDENSQDVTVCSIAKAIVTITDATGIGTNGARVFDLENACELHHIKIINVSIILNVISLFYLSSNS